MNLATLIRLAGVAAVTVLTALVVMWDEQAPAIVQEVEDVSFASSTPPSRGFNRASIPFGEPDFPTSDMAVADFDDDGMLDAVVVTSDTQESHRIYFAFGDDEPLEPIQFGEGSGNRTLVAAADFNEDGYPDILIANGDGFLLYLYDEGEMILADDCGCDCYGAPIQIRVGNLMNSGALDVIVAYETAVVCIPGVGGDFSCDSYEIEEFEEGVIGIELMRMDEEHDPYEHVLILTNDQFVIYEVGEEEATLVDSCGCHEFSETPTAFRRADPQSEDLRLVFAGATKIAMLTWDEGTWIAEDEGDLPWPRTVHQIEPVRFDPQDDDPAYIIRAAGITYIMHQTQSGFEVCEIVGYPDGLADVVARIGDANDSGYDDLILARAGGYHEIFVNGARIEATINDGDDVEQLVDGQAYAEFGVELDAPPVSLVLVAVETDGEDEYEPEGFGMQSFSQGPWRHVPTSQVLTFGIGVTSQTFFVPLTPHFPGPASGQMYAQLLQPTTIGATLGSQSTAQTIIHPMQSPAPQWHLNAGTGGVHAMAHDTATGVTYYGGEFDGFTWDVNATNGIALANDFGHWKGNAPGLGASPDIHCMVSDDNGNLYVGGEFAITVTHPGLGNISIQNVARILPNRQIDPLFFPNPDGPVRTIALGQPQGGPVVESVYLGGKFSKLEHPTISASDIDVRNVARIVLTGDLWTGAGRTIASSIKVSSKFSTSGALPAPQNDDAVVFSIAVWNSPTVINEDVVVIGGKNLFTVWRGSQGQRIANLALVSPRSTMNHFVAPRIFQNDPDPTTGYGDSVAAAGNATVRSVAIAANAQIEGDVDAFNLPHLTHLTAQAIVFAGDFSFVKYRSEGTTHQVPVIFENLNLGLTSVRGHMPSTFDVDYEDDTTALVSVVFDQDDRLWAAREFFGAADGTNAIWVYGIEQVIQGPRYRFVREQDFDVGPDGWVLELAFNPNGPEGPEVVAVGNFSTRPGTRDHTTGVQTFDVPASNITVYSTTTGPDGATYNFGAHRQSFRAGADSVVRHVTPHTGPQLGYAFVGPSVTQLTAERTNLAAVSVGGGALRWGPRTDGPVTALTLDSVGGMVYFGGPTEIQGLPSFANTILVGGTVAGASASLAIADWPVDWYTRISKAAGTPVVSALAVSTDFLIIGGDFVTVAGTTTFPGAAAVELFDPGVVTGDQAPDAWNPPIKPTSGDAEIYAIHVDVGAGPGGTDLVYLGGYLLGTDSIVDVAGFVRCDAPGAGTGAVDVGFDLGLDTDDVVRGVAVNSSGDFCLAGSFWINGATRAGVCFDGASVDFTITASPSGVEVGHAIAVDGNDNVIVGGAFHVIEDGSSPAPERKGVAAFDSSGNLLSWEHDLLSGQPGDEIVRALMVVPHALFGEVVWIGGRYTGPGFGKPSDFWYYQVP